MLESQSTQPDVGTRDNDGTAAVMAPWVSKSSLVAGLIDRQLQAHNRDVYDKLLTSANPPEGFGIEPSCIYFYYVRINRSGTVSVDHYFYDRGEPIPYAEMENPDGILKTLALNARPRTPVKDPPREGRAFENVIWNRRSYIAMFFDERNWTFHRRIGNKPSVAFNVSEGNTPNGSFFDAHDLMIQMPIFGTDRTDDRSAIFFVNHYIDADTGLQFDPQAEKEQSYKFDMYLLAEYARSGAPAMTVIFDPTGTNKSP